MSILNTTSLKCNNQIKINFDRGNLSLRIIRGKYIFSVGL